MCPTLTFFHLDHRTLRLPSSAPQRAYSHNQYIDLVILTLVAVWMSVIVRWRFLPVKLFGLF